MRFSKHTLHALSSELSSWSFDGDPGRRSGSGSVLPYTRAAQAKIEAVVVVVVAVAEVAARVVTWGDDGGDRGGDVRGGDGGENMVCLAYGPLRAAF